MVEATVKGIAPPESTSVDDLARLIDEMQRGNEQALEELYDTTVGKVYALAWSVLRSVTVEYDLRWRNCNRRNGAW